MIENTVSLRSEISETIVSNLATLPPKKRVYVMNERVPVLLLAILRAI